MLVSASLSIAVSQICLCIGLGLLLYRRFFRGDRLGGTQIGWITLALAGWALLNIPFSSDPAQSLVFYRRFFLFAAIWVVAAVANTDKRRCWLLIAMLLGAGIISLRGMFGIYRDTGTFFSTRLGDMSNPMTSGCLSMLVLLTVGGFLLVRQTQRRFRAILAIAAVPVAAGLLLTMTRSAWLGAIAGLIAMLLLAKPRLCALFAVALVVAVVLIPRLPAGTFGGRLADRLDLTGLWQQRNTSVRLGMWRVGLRMIHARPWLGFGDHDLEQTAAAFAENAEGDDVHYGHLHNNQIMLAVIWGLPGLILAMTHFVWQLVLLLRAWRARGQPSARASPLQQGWILGAIGAWAGFFVAGLTEWYFGDAEAMLMYLAIIGAALAAGRPARREALAATSC